VSAAGSWLTHCKEPFGHRARSRIAITGNRLAGLFLPPHLLCIGQSPDKVPHRFNPIYLVIQQFYKDGFFDQDQQFKSLKPVDAKIIHKVRLNCNALSIDT
jgi:hypothetical protein